MYKDSGWWALLIPVIGGILFETLYYAGTKLKSRSNANMSKVGGVLLMLFSIGAYLVLLLFLGLAALWGGQ